MQNFMKTIINALKYWTQSKIEDSFAKLNQKIDNNNERIDNSKADWHENNPNADSYIKNRPFYTENGLVTVQEETAITLDENGTGYYDGSWYPNIGVVYTVIWDGIEYISEPGYSDSDACYRFYVTINGERVNFYEGSTIYGTPAMAGEHTFKVCQEGEIAHAIDMKYLPDVAIKSEVLAEVLAKVDPVGTGSFSMNRLDGSVVGGYSSAIGYGVVANRLSESVIGRFNNYDTSVYGIVQRSNGTDTYHNMSSISCSDSYSFNGETGKFTLDNPTTIKAYKLPVGKYYIRHTSASGDYVKLVTSNDADFSDQKIKYTEYSATMAEFCEGTYLHTVGNGASDSERSNAHTLDWDGNAWYQGDVYVGSTSGTNKDDGSKKLATEEYVDAAIGGIEIPEGDNVELDTTLTQSGKAADAKAVGDVIARFAPVATSGSYNDLTNTPTIPSIEGLATEQYVQEEIAKINVSGGIGEQVQANWEQSDSTQADYIKNKPFGKELGNILDCTFVDSGDGSYMYEDPSSNTLTIGETYTVIWDGVEYTCECLDIETIPAVGNPAAMGGEDNGMPFAMARDVSGLAWGVPMWFAIPLVPNDSGEYKCSIPGMVTKKIDLEYLYRPDWNVSNKDSGSYIANKPFGTITAGSVIEESTVSCNIAFENNLYYTVIPQINIGCYAYNVEFDGVNYNLTGVEHGNGQIELKYALDDGTILFSITKYSEENPCMLVASQGAHTFKITILEDVVQKIDPKYIPEIDALPEVTTDDNGKTLVVSEGAWSVTEPVKGVPEVTSSDAGKFLRVSADGLWVAETVLNAEEVKF